MTSYCMRVLLRLHMSVMRVENSFHCEGCLIRKQLFTRVKGSVAHVPRYHCEKEVRVASGCSAWTHCTWNGCMSCSRRILQTLVRISLIACARLRVLVLGSPALAAAHLQRNYDLENASLDIVRRTSALRLVHYNLQSPTPNAYRLVSQNLTLEIMRFRHSSFVRLLEILHQI